MATLTIRNVPETVKHDLRVAAAKRGVSMEQEARDRLAQRRGQTDHANSMTPEQIVEKYARTPDGEFDLKKLTDVLWDKGSL